MATDYFGGSDADDGLELGGTWYAAGEPGRDGGAGNDSKFGAVNGGLRFPSFNESGSVGSATLELNITGGSGTGVATIYGDDVDDAAAWGSSDKPSGITQTTATAAFSRSSGATGSYTIDVTDIVNEILARGGWSSGNAIRFGIIGSGSGSNEAYWEGINDGGSAPPKLTTTPAATPTRFGGVPFMGAHGAGFQSPVRRWIEKGGIAVPQTPHLWRPAHGSV